jgi:hypothetical protein
MAKNVSAKSYADHRGVSHVAVMKAIKAGRITAVKDGHKWSIDKDKADREWSLNTNESHHSSVGGSVPSTQASNVVARDNHNGPSYAQSRAIKEAYAARLKKLEYEKEMGMLVDAEQIRHEWTRLGISIKEKMLAIPNRLSGQIAGIQDPAQIKRLMLEEIRNALTEVADDE